MAYITRATLPEEFYDITSALLLVQPEPMYLHAMLFKMAMAASLDVDASFGLSCMPDRQFGNTGAAYQTDPAQDRLILSDGLYSESIAFVSELGRGPGHTVRINRPSYIDTTYTQASREVAAGTTISVTPSNITSEQTSITLRRFGGPYSTAQSAVAPIGVDRFDSDVAMHRTSQMVGLHLKRDFDKTLDKFGVLLFDQANLTVYPVGFTDDNSFTSNSPPDGPMTWTLLQSVERQLDELNIPYFANGKRVMVLHPRQCEELSIDPPYQRLARYSEKVDVNPLFAGTFVSEVGTWVIFKSNTLTKTTNTGSITVYRGQAFGPGAVGAGAGGMPRVFPNVQDNYGQNALLIWLWNAGFEVLDSRFIVSVRTS